MPVSRMTWHDLTCAAALAVAPQFTWTATSLRSALSSHSRTNRDGVVSRVTIAGTTPGGAHTAQLDVQQTIKGKCPCTDRAGGNYRNPDDPMFVQGVPCSPSSAGRRRLVPPPGQNRR